MVDLVDTHDSGSCGAILGGSTPPADTTSIKGWDCVPAFIMYLIMYLLIFISMLSNISIAFATEPPMLTAVSKTYIASLGFSILSAPEAL